MKATEQAFLAQVAMGWFSVDEKGRIWRHVKFLGGGTSNAPTPIAATRAERSRARSGSYLRVLFRDGYGVRRKVTAHRIVWMMSNRRPIPSAMDINHLNGAKDDNRPENLELATRAENVLHATRVLGRKKAKARFGEENSAAKVTASDVATIRALAASRELSQAEIAGRFGLKQSTVSAIVLRKSWAHIR